MSPIREPHGGWLGWRKDDLWAWWPNQLRRVLLDGGFHAETIMKVWKARGIIKNKSKGYSNKVCCGPPNGVQRRLICVTATPTATGLDDSSEDLLDDGSEDLLDGIVQ